MPSVLRRVSFSSRTSSVSTSIPQKSEYQKSKATSTALTFSVISGLCGADLRSHERAQSALVRLVLVTSYPWPIRVSLS